MYVGGRGGGGGEEEGGMDQWYTQKNFNDA